ncbi:DUF6090 family protein [Algibacter mikhailovii]|uniref:DUF6090 family protein n=1 Tax=Algibacter mikhailovii TaxID=425498 RepID=UPI002495A66E|nr:DUF6090 family protein [Algibacter mikhailovii]
MIKFFRKIRQNLMLENRTGKYFKYAIGEIILVVIGILIAIQLNDLNENRKEHKKELSFIKKLQEDINFDIQHLTKQDSILAGYISNQEKIPELLLNATSVKDIANIESVMRYSWNNIEIKRKTYNEMLNTSGIYIIKNKELLIHLNEHYALIEKYQQFMREITEDGREYMKNPDLNTFRFLKKHYENPEFDRNRIDTSWIGNYNSPTYLALSRHYNHVIGGVNGNKRIYIKEILSSSNALVNEIKQELTRRNYNN